MARRRLGHEHIPVRFAGDVDRFCREDLSPLLNFHRPCLFAAERADAKGKVRRIHPKQEVATPLAKLKSLPDAASFLRDGATFDALDRAATAQTGLQAAEALDRARDELFRKSTAHRRPSARGAGVSVAGDELRRGGCGGSRQPLPLMRGIRRLRPRVLACECSP